MDNDPGSVPARMSDTYWVKVDRSRLNAGGSVCKTLHGKCADTGIDLTSTIASAVMAILSHIHPRSLHINTFAQQLNKLPCNRKTLLFSQYIIKYTGYFCTCRLTLTLSHNCNDVLAASYLQPPIWRRKGYAPVTSYRSC